MKRRDFFKIVTTSGAAAAVAGCQQSAERILPRVCERVPDAKLWLVGNAPPPEVTALENENVMVTGRVPDVLVLAMQLGVTF